MPAKNSRQSRRPQAKTPLTVSHTTDVRSIWSQRSAQSTDARKRVYSLDEWNETLVEHYDVPTLPGGIAVIKRKIDSEIGSVEAKQNATPKVDGFVSAKTWITIEV